jgi:isopentenyl diphosphate isomerase/L-lactate dehydrogenase-like FMN-dependent dehydrogenase
LRWIREGWKGPIIIKGVLIADDARRAVDEGTSAIVVSNHRARQLDCVLPIIRALPEIVAAVGGKTEILMDGEIRRGSAIVKARCLGARAVAHRPSECVWAGCGWAGGRRTRNQDFARRC